LAQHNNPWLTTTGSELQVVVNHGELCWASSYESWYVMLSQELWAMVCNAEAVVVNHGVVSWASGCESCCFMMINNHWLRITHHD
jgi:hypothetical protein